MSNLERLHNFGYDYFRGPVSREELQEEIAKGNCRLAVQDYFYTIHDLYLDKEEVILSGKMISETDVIKNQGNIGEFFSRLKKGDVVYADKRRNSQGEELEPGSEKFKTEEERLLNLHLGIYLENPPTIWHSSFISKGTALWPIDKFCYYYKPFVARRINK